MNKVLLIVPCYNEEKRLNKAIFLSFANEKTEILFADDGSTDGTINILKELAETSPHCHVFSADKNNGKASVIYSAFQSLLDKDLYSAYDYIGYWDADLATPLEEANEMIRYAEMFYGNVDSIWGSRIYRLGSKIRRSAKRHYLGRIFATVVSVLLDVKSYDSQCGAKLFRSSVAKKAFKDPFISNWVFDIEILLRLKDHNIIEYPVKKWMDVPGSKVKISSDAFKVLKDLRRLYLYYK